jgi:hypothetical protein
MKLRRRVEFAQEPALAEIDHFGGETVAPLLQIGNGVRDTVTSGFTHGKGCAKPGDEFAENVGRAGDGEIFLYAVTLDLFYIILFFG